jgi:hypothetical protein
MHHSFEFQCDNCGDTIETPTMDTNGELCNDCRKGHYRFSGESYDQEFVEQEKYEQQQDREYEDRHRYDDRY